MKEKPDQNSPEVLQNPSSIAGFLETRIETPAGLELFSETTPAEMLKGVFPEGFDAVAGFASGLGIDYGIEIPEWAKQASRQFFKYFFGADFQPLETFYDMGMIAGLIELRIKHPIPPRFSKVSGFIKMFPILLPLLETKVRGASPQETADFYTGRARAGMVFEKWQDPEYLKMVKVAPIYAAVAAGWKCFQQIDSYADAEDFLRFQKTIGSEVDSRECRAVFKRIGFPAGKPGRPKKNTAV